VLAVLGRLTNPLDQPSGATARIAGLALHKASINASRACSEESLSPPHPLSSSSTSTSGEPILERLSHSLRIQSSRRRVHGHVGGLFECFVSEVSPVGGKPQSSASAAAEPQAFRDERQHREVIAPEAFCDCPEAFAGLGCTRRLRRSVWLRLRRIALAVQGVAAAAPRVWQSGQTSARGVDR